MKRVVFNQKGGVGKTTITCNLAAALAAKGKRVLVVDLDAQANTSQYLIGDGLADVDKTIADFFNATLGFRLFSDPLGSAVWPTAIEGLWVIPAASMLAELQPKLESRYKIFKFKQALDDLVKRRAIDHVLIDTPPALNFYSMSALLAADRVLIPFDCDAFSARAVSQVADVVEEVREDHHPSLEIEGIVINQYQSGARLPKEAVEGLIRSGFKVLEPRLSSSVLVRESHSQSLPVVCLRPGHKVAKQYAELASNLGV